MKDENRTKSDLIRELKSLRRKVKKNESDELKRKQREEIGRENNDTVRYVLDFSTVGNSVTQLTGEIQVNQTFCDILGFTKEDLQHVTWQAITHPDDIELTQREIGMLMSGEKAKVRFNKRFIHKNGSIVWADLSSFLRRNAEGEPQYLISSIIDITERKLAEEKLRESEARYRSLFENSFMGISQASLDGRLLCSNASYAHMYGYKNPEEMMNHVTNIGQFYANPEEREEVLHLLSEKGVMEPREMTVKRRDGSRFVVLVSAREIRDSNGSLSYYQAEHVDITERKRLEEMLKNSLENFATLFHSNPAAMAVTKMTANQLVDVNEAWQDLMGFSRSEVVGHSPIELNMWMDIRQRDYIIKMVQEQRIAPVEAQVRNKSGRILNVLMSATSITLMGERYLLTMAQDITEHKQVEEKLIERESRLRALFDNAGYSITLAKNGVQILGNPACAKLFGYKDTAEINGTSILDTIALEERIRIGKYVTDRATGRPVPTHYETKGIRRDGSIFDMEVRVSTYIYNDEIYTVAFQSDITERKLAEEEISKSHDEFRMLANHLQNIREEERTRLAREFHDQLGQSMTALKMDLSLLFRMISDEKQDVQRNVIAEELRSMQKLVDETINMIWVIISELRPQMLEDLGLVATFEWEAQQFESRAGVSCEFKSSAGDIQIDSKKSIALFRIYQEALTNVARHAHASVVKSVLKKEDEMLVLEIKDNGCGFSTEKKSKPGSFGIIGMQERALAFGGLVDIGGVAGEGTTIIIRLPLEKVDEQESTNK